MNEVVERIGCDGGTEGKGETRAKGAGTRCFRVTFQAHGVRI